MSAVPRFATIPSLAPLARRSAPNGKNPPTSFGIFCATAQQPDNAVTQRKIRGYTLTAKPWVPYAKTMPLRTILLGYGSLGSVSTLRRILPKAAY
jgi:hypothetical protein